VISGVGHEVDVSLCDLVADYRAATPTAAAQAAVPDRQELRRYLGDLAARSRRALHDNLDDARSQLQAVLRSSVFRDPLGRVHNRMQRVDELAHRLRAAMGESLAAQRRRLEPAANRLAAQHPARLAERGRARLDAAVSRLRWALGARAKRSSDRLASVAGRLQAVHPARQLKLARQQLRAIEKQLNALDVQAVLRRGFTITLGPDGRPRKTAADFSGGERITTRLADGEIHSDVVDHKTAPRSSQPKRKTRPPKDPPSPGLFDAHDETC
jgi:exodeoxyribonuclease VII large subunit